MSGVISIVLVSTGQAPTWLQRVVVNKNSTCQVNNATIVSSLPQSFRLQHDDSAMHLELGPGYW
jgi:hypothetical protein